MRKVFFANELDDLRLMTFQGLVHEHLDGYRDASVGDWRCWPVAKVICHMGDTGKVTFGLVDGEWRTGDGISFGAIDIHRLVDECEFLKFAKEFGVEWPVLEINASNESSLSDCIAPIEFVPCAGMDLFVVDKAGERGAFQMPATVCLSRIGESIPGTSIGYDDGRSRSTSGSDHFGDGIVWQPIVGV